MAKELTVNFYLYQFVFEASAFFSDRGYTCNVEEVYEVLGFVQEPLQIPEILKSLFVHNIEEWKNFATDYQEFEEYFFYNKLKRKNIENIYKNHMAKISNTILRLEEQLLNAPAEENIYFEKAFKLKKKQEKIPNLEKCVKSFDALSHFTDYIKEQKKFPAEKEMIECMQRAIIKACKYPNPAEIMKALQERVSFINSIPKNENSVSQQIKDKIDHYKKKEEQERLNFETQLSNLVRKEYSYEHRKEMTENKNAVICPSNGTVIPDKKFTKLSETEKQQVIAYIQERARYFRTRMTRFVRNSQRKKLDLSETIKKSGMTDGIPMKLYFQKPKKNKAKLLLFLDVSGSCKEASELMLVFMHTLRSLFPGGCLTYAFINQLYDISKFMEIEEAGAASKTVLDQIPSAGAYSNYELPFRTFYEEHMAEVTGDTYVFFIGDARNNKNPSGEEYVKAIARKAKKAFWLNTDNFKKWNQGDSIIGTYSKYMTKTVEVEKPGQLIWFIGNALW